ncbi:MAG: apolipoprotein N-acyltransferase [Bacteroidota bacterium]|nr:apolipoprotein N-acyltransferase [Candidatus Kapabacteria bacterium]MDW8221237.1 apolipoprotein N-acyltransferase [Bacteroidota bacterium]
MRFLRLPALHIVFLLTLAGFLLGIGFAPSRLGILVYCGFVPLLIVLEQTHGLGQTLRRLYWTFFVFHGLSNWWVSSWQPEADPYLMVAGIVLWIGHPFFFAVPMLGYMALRRRLGRASALVSLPFLWTAFEWLHSLGEASYPWQALGYTQAYYTPVIQIADITGVWGISWIIVAVNAAWASVVLSFRDVPQSCTIPLLQRLVYAVSCSKREIVLVLGLMLGILMYGTVRVRDYAHTTLTQKLPCIHIGIIQPNINPWGKWQRNAHDQVLLHIHLSDSLRVAHRLARSANLDAVLWSETAIPYRILLPQYYPYFEALRAWTDSTHTAIITGLPSDRIYRSRHEAPVTATAIPRMFDTLYLESFNSATIIQAHTITTPYDALSGYSSLLPLHRKMKLTPFAERVPYAEVFSFAAKALTWSVGISGWGLGREQQPLSLVRSTDTVHIGMIICIESIYPSFVAEYARRGARLLAVITNDGWFNHTPGPEQHYMIAALRAVETRRYLARCANTGVSGFITPLGTSLQRTAVDTQQALATALPLCSSTSLYVAWGDWLPLASCLWAAIACLWAATKHRSSVRP